MKNISKQLLKEFWIPLCCAFVWTLIQKYNNGTINSVEKFGATFFFISWLIAQIFRVKKQIKVDTNLTDIETRLGLVATKIEEQTVKLIGTATGLNSFVRFDIDRVYCHNGEYVAEIKSEFKGEYPLGRTEVYFPFVWVNIADKKQKVEGITKSNVSRLDTQIKIKRENQKYHLMISFHGNMKSWTQLDEIEWSENSINVKSTLIKDNLDTNDVFEKEYSVEIA